MAVVLYQRKNGLPSLWHLVDEGEGMVRHLFIDGLHALLGERTGILDLLSALAVRPGVQHAPGTEALLEGRVLRIVRVLLGFLFGVEVVEIAEELVEAVRRRQIFVPIAQMVLAELAGGVAQRLQQFRDGRVFRVETDRGSRHADLGQAGADRVLPGDEGGAPRRAALLAVVIGERRAFVARCGRCSGSGSPSGHGCCS